MSILGRLSEEELSDTSITELYSALGSQDTPRLYERPYRVDTDHDIPTGGANSNDRKVVLLDRTLYAEVMAGQYAASGLTPDQIVERWCDHEHAEKCIMDGDNAVDTYSPAHRRALKLEHTGVLAILGRDRGPEKIRNYEQIIWPGLMRCYHRPVRKPFREMWCGPLLDDPTERDEEILAELTRQGVGDAAKRSKFDVHYGFGAHRCQDCSMYHPEHMGQERQDLAACKAVSGLVRWDRGCDLWMPVSPADR